MGEGLHHAAAAARAPKRPFTKAQFAGFVGQISRYTSAQVAALTHGMWSLDFCAADGRAEALIFVQDLRQTLNDLERAIEAAAETESPLPLSRRGGLK